MSLVLGIAMLLVIVAILAFSSFKGAYAYRRFARSVSRRAAELPLATELAKHVSDLRVTVSQIRRLQEFTAHTSEPAVDTQILCEQFRTDFVAVEDALSRYREQLNSVEPADQRIGHNLHERETVRKIEESLAVIDHLNHDEDWMLNDVKVGQLGDELENLHRLSVELPSFLQGRMHDFAFEVRAKYRTWIILTWVSSILAIALLVLLVAFFWQWIFRPLQSLIRGSRRVASGEFDYRIRLNTKNEMAQLADAMNGMTERFQAVRDDLDRQVRERTRQVVRSEMLASVGFLAAGVAHEINNPLASIALSAESLHERLHDLLAEDDAKADDEHNEEIGVLRDYLRMIQDEAFRCKSITERLLDFSRIGDRTKQQTDLAELIRDVIEMVRHLGKYRLKHIEFDHDDEEPVIGFVHGQEIKQVVLNLITNSLESVDAGGTVNIRLHKINGHAEIVVTDDGCGMTQEVLQHLFEPFFTRRRDGQGTGLGLSITYLIVAEHGGHVDAASDGPGRGARFSVVLPLQDQEKEHDHRHQAA